jgi:hypothetical protein
MSSWSNGLPVLLVRKKSIIPINKPLILRRLGFGVAQFHTSMQAQAMMRCTAVRPVERFKAYAISLKKRCVMGKRMPVTWMTVSGQS